MELNEYARLAAETVDYPGRDSGLGIIYCALAASNEAGELAGWAKKMWRDDDLVLTDERKEQLMGEAGDTMWYLTALAHELQVTFEDIAIYNLRKLGKRYPERQVLVSVMDEWGESQDT